MNYLVLPQTHAHPLPYQLSIIGQNGVYAIVFLVGLPIDLSYKHVA